ncbi:MAG: DNA-processing protein DprA, partial [Pseudomonadota bacterium]
DYPAALSQLADAPPLFWAMGELSLLQKRRVAIVGARNASSLGLRMARALAHELTEGGYVVVSGLARGVDTAAHKAALDGGTIAVMAGGVDVIYPAENTHLGQDIAARGVCLSEQPIGQTPQARHFPTRNRIISGLSEAVVVVEAAAKSGSLITARTALDQGREVLAVPGHPFDARASGCNMLIRDGARLVRNGADIAEALRGQQDLPLKAQTTGERKDKQHNSNKACQQPDALRRLILDHLSPSPLAEDQLIRDLASSAAQMTPALTDLEISGRITRHPGGLVSLAH